MPDAYQSIVELVALCTIIIACLVCYRIIRPRRIEFRYRQRDTHCEIQSSALPGVSCRGQGVGPALARFLKEHGERLNIVLIEEA